MRLESKRTSVSEGGDTEKESPFMLRSASLWLLTSKPPVRPVDIPGIAFPVVVEVTACSEWLIIEANSSEFRGVAPSTDWTGGAEVELGTKVAVLVEK